MAKVRGGTRRRGHREVKRQRVGYTRVRTFTGVHREGWGRQGSPAVAGWVTPRLWDMGLALPSVWELLDGGWGGLRLVALHIKRHSFSIILEVSGIFHNSFLFSLFCSLAVISTILSFTSLIHSSASVILLLIPSRVFLISVILLFITVYLLLISSRSLLNV